jgi:N-acetylglucosaminyldiphosphoundecaprenol N-acetyl-beta-D-mannosaminyltransferase
MRVEVLNCSFDPLTLEQTVDSAFGLLEKGERGWISTVNVSILMMMRADERLKHFVERSSLIVADGQPLVWSAPLMGGKLPERVTGIDLVDKICARAARDGVGVYFLGATEEISRKAAQRIRQAHPTLELSSSSGYFSREEARTQAAAVRNSGARILFVGMGVPRQERFIEENWEDLGVALAVGVGGSFDVVAGLRHRAPKWVQDIGMEWFFRLLQEPRRLAKRYLVTNSGFLYHLMLAVIDRRRRPPPVHIRG